MELKPSSSKGTGPMVMKELTCTKSIRRKCQVWLLTISQLCVERKGQEKGTETESAQQEELLLSFWIPTGLQYISATEKGKAFTMDLVRILLLKAATSELKEAYCPCILEESGKAPLVRTREPKMKPLNLFFPASFFVKVQLGASCRYCMSLTNKVKALDGSLRKHLQGKT